MGFIGDALKYIGEDVQNYILKKKIKFILNQRLNSKKKLLAQD
jgi:hypothetical protein